MIRVTLRGRLGNQMFQFAFAYLTARKNNTNFIIDASNQEWELNCFELVTPYNFLSNKIILKVYNKIQTYFKPQNHYDFRDCFVEYNYTISHLPAHIDGYFQDSRLYEPLKQDLEKIFTIKSSFLNTYKEKYQKLQEKEKTIVISFRLGDYASFNLFKDKNMILPMSWYEEVIDKVASENDTILCISDDINNVEKNFNAKGRKVIYIKEDPITQLMILKNADKCIISNSTFAWWGAFLNRKASEIYCPKYFLGFAVKQETPPNIYPMNWIQLPVLNEM